MNKLAQPLTLAASLLLVAGGAAAAWFFRDRLTDAPKADPRRSDYDTLVTRLGGDEPAVRAELNELMCGCSASLEMEDAVRASRLLRECLDADRLLEIGHVRAFLAPAAAGQPPAYHFVGPAHRARLEAVAGPAPTPERVLAVRKQLARIGTAFGRLREAPDWKVTTEGEPPPMPFLNLMREAHAYREPSDHPELRADPKVAAFAAADGELLAHLDEFFNLPRAKAALPPAKYPKLYTNGRIPPLPTTLLAYRTPIGESIGEEKGYLLPGDPPDPEGLAAVNEVYQPLDQFFAAIAAFEP